jgi:hypothetical protein
VCVSERERERGNNSKSYHSKLYCTLKVLTTVKSRLSMSSEPKLQSHIILSLLEEREKRERERERCLVVRSSHNFILEREGFE